MDHYIDLQLRPDAEIAPHQLMSGLYTRLHRALASNPRRDLGVSFPRHDPVRVALGEVMRLHGSADALATLCSTEWLQGLMDHLKVGGMQRVPQGAQHRTVSRVQAKSSAARLQRRAVRRHGIDPAEAAHRIPLGAEERLALPFVVLGSRSTGQASFRLFIRHGPLRAVAEPGEFSSYGLSSTATVPWF